MIEDLEGAIGRADWPAALVHALDLWRQTRAPDLADLVDRLDAATARAPAGERGHVRRKKGSDLQGWWREHAASYDPSRVAALLEALPQAAGASAERWAVIEGRLGPANPLVRAVQGAHPGWADAWASHLNLLERLGLAATWPDDPRLAPVYAKLLGAAPLNCRWTVASAVYAYLADRLVALADRRVVPELERLRDEPRGRDHPTRELQRALAQRVLDALATPSHAPALIVARVVQLAQRLAPRRVAAPDHAALWREIAEHPDDDGPRAVLADALVEADDPRGHLIALQLDGGRLPQKRAEHLIRTHWHAWLGDLALVATRHGTVFRRGMIEELRVGHPTTPDWAWSKAVGHRELGTVRCLAPAHAPPADYALLAASLPNLRSLVLDGGDLVDQLRAHPPLAGVTRVHYCPTTSLPRRLAPNDLRALFANAVSRFPRLEVIELSGLYGAAFATQLGELARTLPALYRTLRLIRIDIRALPSLAAELEVLPLVELVR